MIKPLTKDDCERAWRQWCAVDNTNPELVPRERMAFSAAWGLWRTEIGDRLENILQKFYDHEQNVRISSFWDADFTAEIGGYDRQWIAERMSPLCKVNELADWLEEQFKEMYEKK